MITSVTSFLYVNPNPKITCSLSGYVFAFRFHILPSFRRLPSDQALPLTTDPLQITLIPYGRFHLRFPLTTDPPQTTPRPISDLRPTRR
ncbi:hypothetical protein L1887_28720 [Cichorium endivia]|nr:hypothetical protein L1887_28720 [Cichorium endivia]